jgi:hypothetical protein
MCVEKPHAFSTRSHLIYSSRAASSQHETIELTVGVGSRREGTLSKEALDAAISEAAAEVISPEEIRRCRKEYAYLDAFGGTV